APCRHAGRRCRTEFRRQLSRERPAELDVGRPRRPAEARSSANGPHAEPLTVRRLALASRARFWSPPRIAPPEARMVPFFVQIKCQLGKSYEVANKLADAEIASEIYSTAGEFDLLVKFYVDDGTDIGHFVNEKV